MSYDQYWKKKFQDFGMLISYTNFILTLYIYNKIPKRFEKFPYINTEDMYIIILAVILSSPHLKDIKYVFIQNKIKSKWMTNVLTSNSNNYLQKPLSCCDYLLFFSLILDNNL